MKIRWVTIAFSSIVLFSCGGSDGEVTTETSKESFIENLSYTSWKKECFPSQKLTTDDSKVSWNTSVQLRIDASLKSTYKTEFFRPTDKECDSTVFETTDISRFEVTGKVISEESIEAYGLNETFIFTSDKSLPPPSYTLIYIDSEKLYLGQKTGAKLGETPETRHSSISLNDYFSQIIR